MTRLSELDRSIIPHFVTLTYPEVFPASPHEAKSHLDVLAKRFSRAFPDGGFIYRLEPQQRGAPHFHLLVWGVEFHDLRQWIPKNWCSVVGSDDPMHLKWHLGVLGHGNTHCVQRIDSWRGVASYAAKYMAKVDIEAWAYPGRFWGIVARQNLPWVEMVSASLSNPDAYKLLRLMRRYAHLKPRAYRSLTIYCDPNYWFDRLDRLLSP
jgi:hypothetical protein